LEQRRKKQEQLNLTTTTKKKPTPIPKPTQKPAVKNNDFKKPLIPAKTIIKKPASTPKPQLSYNEMLKLANKLHEEKFKNQPTKSDQDANQSSKRILPGDIRFKSNQQINNNVNNKPTSSTSSLKPTVLKSQQQQQQVNGTNLKKKESQQTAGSISGKTTSVITNDKGLSAWDRATADLKRKQPVLSIANNNRKRQNECDYVDEEEDEDEHDSDMDDFICDDDDDARACSDRDRGQLAEKNYSKYIREIFKYNPERYKNDEDDPNMEASYNEILKEERKR
jgi:hypothetical protein